VPDVVPWKRAVLTPTVQAIPFVAVAAGLAALTITAALRRGDLVVRLGFVMVGITALPWAVSLTLVACLDDAELARRIYQIGFGPIPIAGSGLLMVILAVVGRLDAQRPVLVCSVILGLAMCMLTMTTDLVIDGVAPTTGGLLFPRAGPLYGVHVGLFALATGWGVWLSRQSAWIRTNVSQGRFALALGVLSVLTVSDTLVVYCVAGMFPLAWLPALVACALSLIAILRQDLLRGRGLDVAVAIELIVLVNAGMVLAVLAAVLDDGRDVILIAAVAVAAGAMVIAGRTAVEQSAVASPSPAIDRFAERMVAGGDADTAGRGLADLLEQHRLLEQVRVWGNEEGRWRPLHLPVGAAADLELPDEVAAWLAGVRRTVAVGDLATARLGARRAAIEAWARRLDADVIAPLVDGDELIGLVAGVRTEALRDSERVEIDDVVRAAARALTVIALTREIHARAELARELELAEAVRQARSAADVREIAKSRIAVSYQPASRVAGDLWSCVDLSDGRMLILVGDVAGRGLAAALVSAAVLGAGQVAAGLLGASATPEAVLTLLHDTVVEVDEGRHRVTAFAAIIDRPGGRVVWASAGHRGGYQLRLSNGTTDLVALIGRGTALGEPERVIGTGSRELGPDDIIVLISDGVVESRAPSGAAWGERRLQRALRELGPRAGDRLGEALLDAATAHAGDSIHDDDLLVVVIAPAQ
jgi:serine phosphatase RsbU (regulator of sigma subunit)